MELRRLTLCCRIKLAKSFCYAKTLYHYLERDIMSFEMFINVSDELLKNKNYDPVVVAFANYFSSMDGKEKIVDEKMFKIYLLETLKLTYYKINKSYEVLFDNGVFEWVSKKDRQFKINTIKDYFVKVKNDTVEKFIDEDQFYAFKIYCYLLRQYNIFNKSKAANKFRGEFYQFSYIEIVKAMGYAKSYEQTEKVKKCLEWMKDNNLINYDDKAHMAPGYKGSYHPLFAVYQL